MKNRSFEVLCHKQIRNARRGSKEKSTMKHSRGQSLSATFGALPGVQFMHIICRFEAREVSNPMLQTVCDSELKWRSYSHWKPITPSWRKILHGCEISLGLRKCCPFAAKFRSLFTVEFFLKLPDICDRHFWIFCFRFLLSKSPDSPCNPPIIGFLSY